MPWAALWATIPIALAISLLVSWRFGIWGLLVPIVLVATAGIISASAPGHTASWVWWTPAAALTGVWMGLREEGGGPLAGHRAWMLIPSLLLAAALPFAPGYSGLIASLERDSQRAEAQWLSVAQQSGLTPERLATYKQSLEESGALFRRALRYIVPSGLFVWIAVLAAAGRGLAARLASLLRWPRLSRSGIATFRLPDGVLAVLLTGLALALFAGAAWRPSAVTLLVNAGLGFCVQGIAVVESLLLSRGVPLALIVLTLVFLFALAMPVFLLSAVVVGLSDVWLDFRRLEPTPAGEA